MQTNVTAARTYRAKAGKTHEGGQAGVISAYPQLLRQVATCLLFEDTFYEKGSTIADEIAANAAKVTPEQLASVAIMARDEFNLRHVPLFLVAHLMCRKAETPALLGSTLEKVIQRADELSEFCAIYAKVNGKKTSELKDCLSAQAKKGLAAAFRKFSPYALAKYNRDSAVRLRDVLFLCHAKPKDDEQKATWAKLVAGTLEAPDTWEVALSAGTDKKATWERLIAEDKLGALALIRNLRNMTTAGVDRGAVTDALGRAKVAGILPYQFLGALRHAPEFAQGIERAMLSALEGAATLPGTTLLLIDVSGSMDQQLSAKGTLQRLDAASALAVYLRETAADLRVFTFSYSLVEVPAHRGLGLVKAISDSQEHGGTHLRAAQAALQKAAGKADRIITVTDEQSQDGIHPAWTEHPYLINVAPYKPGLDTHSGWTRINGWSERIADYIRMEEAGAFKGDTA
jgi:60 kDa SS-A/Ro ribonucleoprotein